MSDASTTEASAKKSAMAGHLPVSWRYRLNHFRNELTAEVGNRRKPGITSVKGITIELRVDTVTTTICRPEPESHGVFEQNQGTWSELSGTT